MMFTVGTDPEGFVIDNEGNIIPVVGLLGGTKKEPLPVNGGFLQEDNVMAEFNIDPASTAEEFDYNIERVIQQLTERIYGVEFKPFHYFNKQDIIQAGPQALAFGCDPDFNAWTGKQNRPPSPYTEMRTAAGHVHIGYDDVTKETNSKIIHLCDLFAGVPSVIMQPNCERRKMYGNAGAFRPKPYGVEYRVLSNFWVGSSELRRWAFNAVRRAYDSLNQYDELMQEFSDVIPDIINSNLLNDAQSVCKELDIEYA